MKLVTRFAAGAAVAALLLASCGDDQDSVESDTTAPLSTSNYVDADDVLLAGLLLTIGDIDRAVATGLVNPEEVDAAIAALDTDSMQKWAEQAE